jgi:hypothetical protein
MPTTSGNDQQMQDYFSMLVRIIPAEIVTAFVTVDGVVRSSQRMPASLYWCVFVILLLITPLFSMRVKRYSRLQAVVCTLSFAVWTCAIGGPFRSLSWYDPAIGSVTLAVYTLIVPILLTGRSEIPQ